MMRRLANPGSARTRYRGAMRILSSGAVVLALALHALPAAGDVQRRYAERTRGLLCAAAEWRGSPALMVRPYHTVEVAPTTRGMWQPSGGIRAGEGRVQIACSRLSPAAVVATESSRLELFCDLSFQAQHPRRRQRRVLGSCPRYAAVATADGVVVARAPRAAPCGDMTENWMLVWFGHWSYVKSTPFPTTPGYHWGTMVPQPLLVFRDRPWLLVFEKRPAKVALHQAEGYDDAADWPWDDFGWHDTWRLRPVGVPQDKLRRAGLTIEWSGAAGSVVMMPLFGARLRSPTETETWRRGLPADVLKRCRQWSRRLLAYPTAAHETAKLAAGGDRLDVAVRVSFHEIADGWKTPPLRAAPVPPYVYGAAKYGLGVEWSKAPTDLDCPTYLGPTAVVDAASEYTWSFQGFARYAEERMAPKAPPGPASSSAVRDRLAEEVDELLSANWAPLFLFPSKALVDPAGKLTPLRRFSYPADLPLAIAPALPYLDEARRGKVLAYVRRRLGERPLGSGEWPPPWKGARQRVLFPVPEGYLDDLRLRVRNPGLGPEGLYVLGTFADELGLDPGATAPAPDEVDAVDWAAGNRSFRCLDRTNWPYGPRGGEHDSNRKLMELIGRVRLAARRRRPRHVESGKVELARELIRRYWLRKYVRWLYDGGIVTLAGADEAVRKRFGGKVMGRDWATFLNVKGNPTLAPASWRSADDDVRAVMGLDRLGLGWEVHARTKYSTHCCTFAVMDGMCPEVARFFRDRMRDEARRFFARLDYRSPDWHFAWTPNQEYVSTEGTTFPPQSARDLFVARAWILRERPETLRRFLGEPWCHADLDHVDKLRAALDAAAGERWVPISPK